MSELTRIEKYSPTFDFYNLTDKLYLNVLKRSEAAFDKADRGIKLKMNKILLFGNN